MYGSLAVRFYETPSGRRPVPDFLDGLPARLRAQVMADCVAREIMWLLRACRKQDQVAGIDVARERMRRVA